MKNQSISRKVLSAIVATSLISAPALAGQPDWLSIEAEMQAGATDSDSGTNADMVDAEVLVSAKIVEGLSAHFRAEFGNNIDQRDIDDLEDLAEELYIVVEPQAFGMSLVHMIRIGQQEIDSFGLQKRAVPLFKDSPLYFIETQERRVGVTAQVSNKILAEIVDDVSIAVYKQGDESFMSTSGNTTLAAKVTKNFQDVFGKEGNSLTLGASIRNEFDDNSSDDRDISLSADYVQGKWNAYAQLIIMDNDSEHPDADYVGQVGINRQLAHNFAIGAEYVRLDKKGNTGESQDDVTGYLTWQATDNLELGASLTHRSDENGDDLIPGVSAKVTAERKGNEALLKSSDRK